jgi:hypothetical protein
MDIGVNLDSYLSSQSGVPAWYFPTNAEVAYYAAQGMKTIRVALSWEALQPILDGPLDASYVAKIANLVSYSATQGVRVILDIHNYGAYNGSLIGSAQTPVAAFADMWGKLAGDFATSSNVMFGLMNEPQLTSANVWLAAVNSAIASIRGAGANQEVLISGLSWDSAANWIGSGNAATLGAPGAIVDPAKNYAFEVHQYLDAWGAGQTTDVASSQTGVEDLEAVTAWATQTGNKLFLGETGVGTSPTALAALTNMLSYMQLNSNVWQGATYFAGGLDLQSFIYSIEPELGLLGTAQMSVLDAFTGATHEQTQLLNGDTLLSTFVSGRANPSFTAEYSAGGTLVSTSLYAADGALIRNLGSNADGSLTLSIYDDSGVCNSVQTYNSAYVLMSASLTNSDGGKTCSYYNIDSGSVAYSQTFNAAGMIVSENDNNSDGTHSTKTFVNGVLSLVQNYDANWNMTSQSTYDSSGALVSVDQITSSGAHVVAQYSAAGGETSVTDYTSSWAWTTETDFDASGNITTIKTVQANDTIKVDTFVAGSSNFSTSSIYDSSWQCISTTTANAVGTYTVVEYSSPGSGRVATSATYSSSWRLLSMTTYDADGLIAQVQSNDANGGFAIAAFSNHGSANPSTVSNYTSAWQLTETDSYNLAGQLVAVDHVQSNGGHLVDQYTAGVTAVVASEAEYDASWRQRSVKTYDSEGLVVQIQTDNADGGFAIAAFGVHGGANPSTVSDYDSAWQLTETDSYDSAGQIVSVDHVQSNGAHVVDQYAAGVTTPTTETTFDANWRELNSTSFDAKGLVSKIQTDKSDGTISIASFAVHGSAHASTVTDYTSAWKTTEIDNFNSAGQILSIDKVLANGDNSLSTYANGDLNQPTLLQVFDHNWLLLSSTPLSAHA